MSLVSVTFGPKTRKMWAKEYTLVTLPTRSLLPCTLGPIGDTAMTTEMNPRLYVTDSLKP